MAGSLTDVTDTNFQAEVIESDTPVLVDFWAPWCGPCRVVAPVLEEIAAERDDLRIVKLNVDENQQTAAAFEVLSIPTLILFKNGQVAKKIIGAYPRSGSRPSSSRPSPPEPPRRHEPRIAVAHGDPQARSLAEPPPAPRQARATAMRSSRPSIVAGRARAVVGVLDARGERLAGDVGLVRARGVEQLVVAAERQRDAVLDLQARPSLRAFWTAWTTSRARPSRRRSSSSASSSATACEPSRSSW